MIIKLRQMSDKASNYRFQLPRSGFTKLDDHLMFDQMECVAILQKKADTILLTGQYQVEIDSRCDLCLCPMKLAISEDFELVLQEEAEYQEPEGDQEISVQSDDVEFFNGQEIDLSRFFEDQLILDLPLAKYCGDDCRGLCSTCGANLNETECECARDSGSHPFSILKDI